MNELTNQRREKITEIVCQKMSKMSSMMSDENNLSLPPLQSLKKILLDWGVSNIIDGGIEGLSPDLHARVVPHFSNGEEMLFSKRVRSRLYII